VTTPQSSARCSVARTESINVSMEPLRQILPYYLSPQPNPTIRTILYTISGVEVMDMTACRPPG